MTAFQLLLAPLLLAAYPPGKEAPPAVKWDDKIVFLKQATVEFGQLGEDNMLVDPTTLVQLQFQVLADRNDWLQIKTMQGVTGWIKKSDAVTLEEAIPYFTMRIEQSPDTAEAYNRRAACWTLKGEPDAAIKDFTEALRIQPNAGLFNNRALAHMSKKDFDKALEDFNEAIDLAPSFAPVLNNRGNLYHQKKEYNRAIEDFSEAIKLDPKYAMAYRNRGITSGVKKDFDAAIADHTKVLELDPKSALAYSERGGAYSGKNDHPKALADYTEALKLEPKNAGVCNNVAWQLATCPHEKLRDGKRAVELAKQAVGLFKNSASYLDTLAAAYAEVGNFEEAVRAQELAMKDAAFAKEPGARERLELYRNKKPYRQPE